MEDVVGANDGANDRADDDVINIPAAIAST
jgi:hypothetical protein